MSTREEIVTLYEKILKKYFIPDIIYIVISYINIVANGKCDWCVQFKHLNLDQPYLSDADIKEEEEDMQRQFQIICKNKYNHSYGEFPLDTYMNGNDYELYEGHLFQIVGITSYR